LPLSETAQLSVGFSETGFLKAQLLQFLAHDNHRMSHRFFVHEWKGKRHVLIEFLQARNIGTALSQDLPHLFFRFEKVVVPE
jgi:hypothetical protein